MKHHLFFATPFTSACIMKFVDNRTWIKACVSLLFLQIPRTHLFFYKIPYHHMQDIFVNSLKSLLKNKECSGLLVNSFAQNLYLRIYVWYNLFELNIYFTFPIVPIWDIAIVVFTQIVFYLIWNLVCNIKPVHQFLYLWIFSVKADDRKHFSFLQICSE